MEMASRLTVVIKPFQSFFTISNVDVIKKKTYQYCSTTTETHTFYVVLSVYFNTSQLRRIKTISVVKCSMFQSIDNCGSRIDKSSRYIYNDNSYTFTISNVFRVRLFSPVSRLFSLWHIENYQSVTSFTNYFVFFIEIRFTRTYRS